jgi:acetyl esterase/lipase
MRYVRSHAAQLGLDSHRLVAIGSSAGGHLAIATALFDGIDENGEDPAVSCRPDAVIMLSPVIDTSEKGYGHAKIGERWRELSPLHQVRAGLPPMLLFHGTADRTVPFAGAEAFHAAAVKAGNVCEFVIGGQGAHVYVMKEERAYKECLRRIAAFLVSMGILSGTGK